MARNQKLQVDIEANDRASGKIDKVGDKADRLDKSDPSVDITADDQASATLDDVSAKLEDLGVPAGKLSGSLGKGGAAGAAIALGGALVLAGQKAADVAFEAENLATLTGDSVEEASRLNAVWKQSGADTKDLQDVLLQMNGVLATNADLAGELGINLNDGATVGERFEEVAKALDKIPDAAKRSQIASQVFGEEGVRQYNAMRNSVGDLSDALRDVPEGSVITDEEVAKAREMQAQMRELTAEFQAFATAIGSFAIPAMGAVVSGFNDMFDAAEQTGRSIRSLWDGGASQQNHDFVQGVEAAERAAREFDLTLLDGVTTFAEARAKAGEYTATMDNVGDDLLAATHIALRWNETQEEGTEATEEATEAIDGQADAAKIIQNEIDKAASNFRRFGSDGVANMGAVEDAAEEVTEDVNRITEAFEGLRSEISDRSAYLSLQDTFDDVQTAAEESWTAASEGAEDAEQKARDHEQAMLDLKGRVIDYAEEVENIPPEQVSEIVALIDEGALAEAEAKLAHLERVRNARINVTTNYQPVNIPVSGVFHDGGVVPGPRGSEQLILAKGGETVLPTHKPSGGSGGTGGGGPLDLSDDTLRRLSQHLMAAAGVAANGAIARSEAQLLAELRGGAR